MRALRIVSLFLRDSAWTAFVVMAASLAPLTCMLLLDGGSLAVDWPYFLFLSLFLLFVLFAVHLARSWGFLFRSRKGHQGIQPDRMEEARRLDPCGAMGQDGGLENGGSVLKGGSSPCG